MTESTVKPADAINAILAEAGVTMTATHVPSSYDPKRAKDDFQGIKWTVKFTRGSQSFSTGYTEGIGHLPETVYRLHHDGLALMQYELDAINYALKTGTAPDGRTASGGSRRRPLAPPSPADVLYCLISDASAADYEEFEDWARDMGYDADSRKAEAIWRQCRDIAHDLNRVIGHDLLEKLRPLAQEM